MATAYEARYTTGPQLPHNKFQRIFSEISKFAVDSIRSGSLKGVRGPKKLNEIVQEKLEKSPTSFSLHNCKKPERMQISVEEMLEDMEKLKLQNGSSAKCFEGKEPLEKGPNEDSKRSYVLESEKRRIFIRSRL